MQRLHLVVTAGLAVAVVVLTAVLLRQERAVGDPPVGNPPAPAGAVVAPARPPGPMIEEVKRAPGAFKFGSENDSALDVRLFRYSGTYIDARIEIEIDGKWIVSQEVRAKALLNMRETVAGALSQAGAENSPPEGPTLGYLVWARRFGKGNEDVTSNLLLTEGGPDGQRTSSGVGESGLLYLRRTAPLPRAGAAASSLGLVSTTFATGAAPAASGLIGALRPELLDGKADRSSHFWAGSTAGLPARLDREITLLDGAVGLSQGDRDVKRKVRLKCRPWSPDAPVK